MAIQQKAEVEKGGAVGEDDRDGVLEAVLVKLEVDVGEVEEIAGEVQSRDGSAVRADGGFMAGERSTADGRGHPLEAALEARSKQRPSREELAVDVGSDGVMVSGVEAVEEATKGAVASTSTGRPEWSGGGRHQVVR